jgi:hypothetical protein
MTDTIKANHTVNLLKSAKVRWPGKTAEEYAEGAIRVLTTQLERATSPSRRLKLEGAIQRWTVALEELRK